MAIPEGHRNNFNTLLAAAKAGRLALMECKEAATGRIRYVLCTVSDSETPGEMVMTPFGHLYDEEPFDPYGAYLPPDPDGGFYQPG